MLKPIQVSSRAQWSEQCSSEDDDDVLFAAFKAHPTRPFSVVLDLLYDVTCTDSSLDVTGTVTCNSSSSNGRSIGTSIVLFFAFCLIIEYKPTKWIIVNTLVPVAWQWGGTDGQSPGGLECRGPRVPGKKRIKNTFFSVTVKIRNSGHQTLECFTATLQT